MQARWGVKALFAVSSGACAVACGDTREQSAEAILSSSEDGVMLPQVPEGEDERRLGPVCNSVTEQNPKLYGYTAAMNVERLPGEYEPIQRLYVAWAGLTSYVADMVKEATPYVPATVVLNCGSGVCSAEGRAKQTLAGMGVDLNRVSFVRAPIETIWIRDYGPLFVKAKGGGESIIDIGYYPTRNNDDAFPTRLAQGLMENVYRPALMLEGGNIQSNGAGVCITSEKIVPANGCHGTPYTEDDVREIFKNSFGCQKLIIVPRLDGERTGHIDMYVHVTDVDKVLVGAYDPAAEPENAKRVDEGAKRLENGGFTVTRIPMPPNEDREYRTYTNALAINDAVMVPVYTDSRTHEQEALTIFANAYPQRKIIPIDATDIIQSGGAIHCTTMTEAN